MSVIELITNVILLLIVVLVTTAYFKRLIYDIKYGVGDTKDAIIIVGIIISNITVYWLVCMRCIYLYDMYKLL